jgi:hypothetical protein
MRHGAAVFLCTWGRTGRSLAQPPPRHLRLCLPADFATNHYLARLLPISLLDFWREDFSYLNSSYEKFGQHVFSRLTARQLTSVTSRGTSNIHSSSLIWVIRQS